MINAPYVAQFLYGYKYEVESPEIGKYSLVNPEQSVISGEFTEDTKIKDKTLYAKWQKFVIAKYKAEHFVHTKDGGYELFFTEDGKGIIAKSVLVSAFSPQHEQYPKDYYFKADYLTKTIKIQDGIENKVQFHYNIETANRYQIL